MARARGHSHAVDRRPARRRGGGTPRRWADGFIESQLREFTAGMTSFPRLSDFRDANRGDLASAVVDHGGAAYWAERIGLPLPPERIKRRGDVAVARAQAQEVIWELGRLPSERELRRLGHRQLATAVRRAGGSVRFRATFRV